MWPPEERGRRGQHRARPAEDVRFAGERARIAEEPAPPPPPARPRRARHAGMPKEEDLPAPARRYGGLAGVPKEDDLPPSARWYGAPAAPAPARVSGPLRRVLLGLLAVLVAGGAVAWGAALLLRTLPSSPGPAAVSDPAAGVRYPLPEGWRTGGPPPVTGFTSVAGRDGLVTVLTRPADPVTDARKETVRLADLYGRLLLHGDEVKVVEDREVTVGGRTGYSRTLRAEYRDVVNRPAYLRVVFLTGQTGPPVVVLAAAQPDDPRTRAELDTVVAGIR
ncbi:hypothetical protein [Streptosporangium sandarakinum]|uniref:Uncharacterized protein n=1 Tax=Streptosporangium sandarakinum TaxID=1260955 RepID=A0A852UPY7_9ACTN|nr:hypothetical protein [Streptosporangium sandarakinum]NYF39547.1 hypothetical protein [Streptosporangium sandarakinum]